MVVSKNVLVANHEGLHALVATALARTAARFRSRVALHKDGQRVDATRVLDVLMLTASRGSTVTVEASGEDAAEAVDALERLFAGWFAELPG